MALEFRIPEILRVMLLAHEETGLGRILRRGESQGEGDLRLAAVGAAAAALEVEGLEGADARLGEQRRIRLGVLAVEDEHGQTLAIQQVILDEGAEAEGAGLVRGDGGALAHRDQLDEGACELHEPVFGAPRMPIARSDLESQTPIEASGFVEIANGNDEMIDPAGHRALSCDESIDLGSEAGFGQYVLLSSSFP